MNEITRLMSIFQMRFVRKCDVIAVLFLSLALSGCSGNYERNSTNFTAKELEMVGERTGISIPSGSRGLNLYYEGGHIDPCFLAKIDASSMTNSSFAEQIEKLPNEEISFEDSLIKKVSWWNVSKEEVRCHRRFSLKSSGDFVDVSL